MSDSLLMWDKPERKMSKEEWSSIGASDAPPGVYTSNMSDEDRFRWKAKLVGTRSGDLRVEIRKTTEGHKNPAGRGWIGGAQTVLVVRPNGKVIFSSNSKAEFDFEELTRAVEEARERMREVQK